MKTYYSIYLSAKNFSGRLTSQGEFKNDQDARIFNTAEEAISEAGAQVELLKQNDWYMPSRSISVLKSTEVTEDEWQDEVIYEVDLD